MRKKQTICFCLLSLFISSSIAQLPLRIMPQSISDYQVVDSGRFVIRYSLDFVEDPDKLTVKESDIILLELGKNISKSYSYNLYRFDSILTDGVSKGTPGLPFIQKTVPPLEVFKNYPKGKITVTYRSPYQGPVFKYIEDEVNFNWIVHREKKNILGYTCQKATSTFRGRTWTAWFTNEIPVSDGPWKFCGLPGLILSVSDDKEHYSYNCIGIDNKTTSIKVWDWKYENTTREKLNAFIKRAYESPLDYMKASGQKVNFIGMGSTNASIPFNPIELE